jgi:ubiquinone biosynthesis protein
MRDNLGVAVETVRKIPGLVTRAEAALDDYDADKNSPQRRFNRFMVVGAFWLLVIIALILVVRGWR